MIHFVGKEEVDMEGVVNSTMEKCYEYCKNKEILGLDIETTRKYKKGIYNEIHYKPGLDPYLSNVCMTQIGDADNQWVIDTRVTDISPILPLFADNKHLFVIHNALFESRHLKHSYNITFYNNIYDTMLIEQTITNGLQYSKKDNPDGYRYTLEALANRYLGIESSKDVDLFNQLEEDEEYVDKSIRTQFVEWGDKPFTERQIKYGADDIIFPIKIREKQMKNKYYSEFLATLENNYCLVLGDMMLKGIGFEPEKWLETYRSKLPIYQARQKMLDDYVIANHPSFCKLPDLFDPSMKCNISWPSSAQVVKFFTYLGFCPKERSKETKKMEYTVGKKALFKLLPTPAKEKYMGNEDVTEIVDNESLILAYLLFKKTEQQTTTFGEDFLRYIHPITGRIHSNYQQIMNTGRISSYKPNMQNIPAEEDYRHCFVPIKGNSMICADYSQQESRIAADLSGDESMIDLFNNGHPIFGDDIHSLVATRMFSMMRRQPDLIILKKTHPKERNDAKTIGFKVIYGGSAYTLKDDFGVEEDVAQEFVDNYFKGFPGVKKFIERVQNEVLKTGIIVIDTLTKRIWIDKDFRNLEVERKKILSLYPEGYGQLDKEEKDSVKKKLYEKHPHIPEFWKKYRIIKGKVERNASNYPIQGLAGSMTKMAGVLFRQWQLENGKQDEIFLVNVVHDEYTAETTNDSNYKIVQECMEKGGNMFVTSVQMKAEAIITKYWKK